jgi:hypothetical protein
MKKYQLNKENFIKEKNLHIERFEFDNIIAFECYKPHIQFLIDSFNTEYKWDDMFDINDAENRIVEGHILFILYYDSKEIGYVWFKEIDKNICYLYNLYVTNILYRPEYSPIWFINETSSVMLKYYKKIQCECEDWNTSAQNVFTSNGFYLIDPVLVK